MLFQILLFASVATCLSISSRQTDSQHAKCRFSPALTQDQVMKDLATFEDSIFYWDGHFHQDGVGYQASNGMTIDHVYLGYATGLPDGPPTMRSNPKNEAFQIMLLTHAIAENRLAGTFLSPLNTTDVPQSAVLILGQKLITYIKFNQSFPGYGGFLPKFESNSTNIWPTENWTDRVSATDNGYLIWAVYGLIQALKASPKQLFQDLGNAWTEYFVYMRTNVKGIFLHDGLPGTVCAISTLKSGIYPYASSQSYGCESSSGLLDDPYQGELMTWFLYLSGTLNISEGDALWTVKRPQLQAVNYTGSIVTTTNMHGGPFNYTGNSIVGRHITPITTQKGRYFGAQEHLKFLFLPYLDVPIANRVMKNAERVRTCNSALMDKTSGMFAAVNNVTSPTTSEQNAGSYIESAGIPSAAIIQTQEQDVLTPYASFATILFDKNIGLAWYKNVLDAKCMQSVYGSVAGIRRDGSQVSRFVSWETKAPVLLALLGGIVDFVREGLKSDGVLEDFIEVTDREYGLVFDETRNGGSPLMGEKVEFCMPGGKISGLGLIDYSSCSLHA